MAPFSRPGLHAWRQALILAACFTLLWSGAARAVPPKYFEFSSPAIDGTSGSVIVTVGISVDNLRGLFDMLKDGATLELRVKGTFERVRALWSNVVFSEKEYVYILRHNPLTREFAMFMPGEAQPLLDKNLNRLLTATWSKFTMNLGPLSMLANEKPDTEYRASLAVTLQHVDVPPWLAKNFVFWSKNVVEPETVTLPFRY